MDLQYIYDDTTSPPTQSVLQYKVDPDTVYVSTDTEQMMVNLTITVFNPTQATVNCQNFQFGIYVGTTRSGQLASTSAGIHLTTAQSQWSTNSAPVKQGDLYWYTAQPARGAGSEPLAAADSFIFQLTSIPINKVEGGTQFVILETTDADPDGVQGLLSLAKEPGSLSISNFSVLPPTPISPGTEVNISWGVSDAQYWLLYNTTLSKLLYDSRKQSPPQTSWTDTPEAWTEYELIAYAGQIFTFATAVAQVSNPRFVEPLPAANPQTVDSGAASTLSWQTAAAEYVIVTAEGYTSGKIDSSSGQGRLQVNPISATLYTLTPYAADNSAGGGNNVQVYVNPPEIESFSASPQLFTPGQAVILSWQTSSATSATLTPGGNVPVNKADYEVYPNKMMTYTLTATGQGSVERQVSVVGLAGTYGVGAGPSSLAYDLEYIWVSNERDGTVTRLRASDGSLQGTYAVGANPQGLAYDGIYIWVANGGDGTVTRLRASDGGNQGTYGVGSGPTNLVYDGTYIWAANFADNTVTKLLARDGSLQGTYGVGASPSALVYDGTYIWVANYDDSTVTRLLAANGSNQGTFSAGQGPSALAYDGTYIWVGDAMNNTITILLASNGSQVVSAIPANDPQALLYDGAYIWSSNWGDAKVTKLTTVNSG